MKNETLPEVGSILTIQKPVFDQILSRLKEDNYLAIGPRIRNESLVYEVIEKMEDLPRGYTTEQKPGRFRLFKDRHSRYFDIIPGAHSWKQFLFLPRAELFKLRKNGRGWETTSEKTEIPKYAFIGVRACELAAIQIQDGIFMRGDFTDPIYHVRRGHVFVISVNCTHPVETCFCVSMNTGPQVKQGFDLNITELDDLFVLTIGSELARRLLTGIPFENASGYILTSVEQKIGTAVQQMGRKLDPDDLPQLILDNLDHPYWNEIGMRCLSCANCTQVCPTCFCWDVVDEMGLDGKSTRRERIWDSCFNPGYSYQAGGNTRPTIYSRYRQWLSHKLGTWKQQFGNFGCTGCGRCITWCPAEIDLTEEIAALRMEVSQ
ncbi:MAG TPA: 4Fe-4S dicluster domain-containing protein [Anaerolineales bacterium]|nr:4Fe-4S dicluster domain-containing protein [Anaerolineales bacterium]